MALICDPDDLKDFSFDTEALKVMALKQVFSVDKFAELFGSWGDAGQATGHYSTLHGYGVKVEIQNNKMSLVGPDGNAIVGGLGLADGVVVLAKEGKLPKVAKVPVMVQLDKACEYAMDTSNWTHKKPSELKSESPKAFFSDWESKADDDYSGASAAEVEAYAHIKITPEVAASAEAMAKHTAAPTDEKVKLSNAEVMYQQVFGTSESSTYYCVGIAGDMKFAARRKGADLSVRVEGPVADHHDNLVAAGFNASYIPKGYTSVHFHGIDDLMATRALGAVLMGTDLDFDTPLPKLAWLVS